MGWFNFNQRESTHTKWNKTLEDKGLEDDDKTIECNKNYKEVVGEDNLSEYKTNKNLNFNKSLVEQFTDKEKDNNTNLQKEQINKVKDNDYDNKSKVKDDLEEVRKDNKWRLW